MKTKEMYDIFCDNFRLFQKSIDWLSKSYNKCKNIQLESLDVLKEDELEKLEALTNRFSRSVDILINKILRGLDLIELEDMSRNLDIVIRAEKRGFVADYEEIINLKDLRNELSHEYMEKFIIERFKETIEKVPIVLDINDKIIDYVNMYKYC